MLCSSGLWTKYFLNRVHPYLAGSGLVPCGPEHSPASRCPGSWKQFLTFNSSLICIFSDLEVLIPSFANHSHNPFAPQQPGWLTWSGEFRKHHQFQLRHFVDEMMNLLAKKLSFAKGVYGWLWSNGQDIISLDSFLVIISCALREHWVDSVFLGIRVPDALVIWEDVALQSVEETDFIFSSTNKWETSLVELGRVVLSGNQETSYGSCLNVLSAFTKA